MSQAQRSFAADDPARETAIPMLPTLHLSNAFLDWLLACQRSAFALYAPVIGASVPFGAPSFSTAGTTVPVGEPVVVQLGEERLNVGTKVITGDTTVVRRDVIEVPVEQNVRLRQERVVVERRRPTAASATDDMLRTRVFEMTDTTEIPVVWKDTQLREEVVLRKEVSERTETVRGTVRRDVLHVNEPRRSAAQARVSESPKQSLITDPVELARPVTSKPIAPQPAASASAAPDSRPPTAKGQ